MSSTAPSPFTVSVDQISPREWEQWLEGFEDASVYQTRQFGVACWDERQLSHLVLRREGRVVAMAQIRIIKVPLLDRGVAFIRWGPLMRRRGAGFDEQVMRQMTAALCQEYVVRRGLLLRVIPNLFENDPGAETIRSHWLSLGFKPNHRVHHYHTARVDLSPDLDTLRANLQSRWRSYLKNAEKAGFIVTMDCGDDQYERFARMYHELMARKHFETGVDIEDFRQVQRTLPAASKMQVLVCQKDGVDLNALVVSAHGDTGIYLLAATSDEGLKTRGAYLLQWRAMEHLKQQGFRWYDLGGMNPDRNPGVYQFKSGLGGAECSHLGCFELSGHWLSTASVALGEKLRALKRRAKP
jgi:lipid II:glycine glycyltransferase (peptidoglycan interpeptide bridge formation enzyme)